MVPNLTGFVVSRCATFHIAVYCRLPGPTGPVILGSTRFEEIVQNVPAGSAGRHLIGARLGRLGKAGHVCQRIALPTHATDLLVEMRVTVGDDVETSGLLRAQVDRYRILVLLAVAQVHHRLEETLRPQSRGVPARARQRSDD